MKTILITGGAGFVGSAVSLFLSRSLPDCKVIAVDNLKRRGSEHNLAKLKKIGIEFFHCDIRNWHDLESLPKQIDCIIEASAEPSVSAGLTGSPRYLIDSNLNGAINCLELARIRRSSFIFLSTSRVYSIETINSIPLKEDSTRFSTITENSIKGLTEKGITEAFDTSLPRSLYGATKLSAENFVQEYSGSFGLPAIINRCGVICGPGQFGKIDQGVYTLWVANHIFKQSLSFTGYGGKGKQIRDLLHISDLCNALSYQLEHLDQFHGDIFNLGGGMSNAISLSEYTEICASVTGNSLNIGSIDSTTTVDIPWYVTDHRKFTEVSKWVPVKTIEDIVEDIYSWIIENRTMLTSVFSNS